MKFSPGLFKPQNIPICNKSNPPSSGSENIKKHLKYIYRGYDTIEKWCFLGGSYEA